MVEFSKSCHKRLQSPVTIKCPSSEYILETIKHWKLSCFLLICVHPKLDLVCKCLKLACIATTRFKGWNTLSRHCNIYTICQLMRDTKGGFWLVHTWCKEKLLVDKNDDKKLHLRGTTNRNLKTAVALFGFARLPSGAGRPELQTTGFSADTILIRFKKQCNRE